ncbi:hypothetical protein C0583_06545 [Candidatus Parcubacteria bacterium]|nr:MAG: hypothetical protein C0583_06545 [Candidatus Parcubacteria bacterium]
MCFNIARKGGSVTFSVTFLSFPAEALQAKRANGEGEGNLGARARNKNTNIKHFLSLNYFLFFIDIFTSTPRIPFPFASLRPGMTKMSH